jgi:hypothetical protein
MNEEISDLLNPKRVWSRSEVLGMPCPVPRAPGLYVWYFKEIPPRVPTEGCVMWQGLTLLYAGISPSEPPRIQGKPSRRNLRSRIREHMRSNAYGSTLRLSLGCLLREHLGIRLRLAGKGKRRTFGEDESVLSEWMGQNAFVSWVVYGEPWLHEEALIETAKPPLNLRGNEDHPFHPILSEIRRQCKGEALAAKCCA